MLARDDDDFLPLRIGLLGLSPHSRTLVDAARQSNRVNIVAAAVRDKARLESWSVEEELEGIRVYKSYNELLRDEEVDAVRLRGVCCLYSLPRSARRTGRVSSVLIERGGVRIGGGAAREARRGEARRGAPLP